MRADMGSNTEAVWWQAEEFSNARNAVRNSWWEALLIVMSRQQARLIDEKDASIAPPGHTDRRIGRGRILRASVFQLP